MQNDFFATRTRANERLAHWDVYSLMRAPRFRCLRAGIHKSCIELAGQAAINVPRDVNDNTSVFLVLTSLPESWFPVTSKLSLFSLRLITLGHSGTLQPKAGQRKSK